MQILTLLPKVAQEIGAIAKSRKNEQQGYKFRGIDDVLNAVHGPLCKHGITPTSEVADILREERTSSKGGLLIYTRLTLKVTWHAPDGSTVSTTTAGEAMDSADKSTNKAMSAALKYAYFQTFSIPLEEEDADQVTPEPAPKAPPKPAAALYRPLAKQLQAMGATSPEHADALLRLCFSASLENAKEWSQAAADSALEIIGNQIAERMKTIGGSLEEAHASILAEALEKASKK